MVELDKFAPRKIARNLSNKLSIPHYELDNVVWKRVTLK